MFEITVIRLSDGKMATEQASRVSILKDHLEASCARQGFSVGFHSGDMQGGLWRDGVVEAHWSINKIEGNK
jgi:hypothetical protein